MAKTSFILEERQSYLTAKNNTELWVEYDIEATVSILYGELELDEFKISSIKLQFAADREFEEIQLKEVSDLNQYVKDPEEVSKMVRQAKEAACEYGSELISEEYSPHE